jgi:flagellar biosynthesis protein FlhF
LAGEETMRIKRFEATTIQEALRRVKQDLGPEAVILYTKKFKRGGLFGLFGQERAEITAGLDMNIVETKSAETSRRRAGPVACAYLRREDWGLPGQQLPVSPGIPE